MVRLHDARDERDARADRAVGRLTGRHRGPLLRRAAGVRVAQAEARAELLQVIVELVGKLVEGSVRQVHRRVEQLAGAGVGRARPVTRPAGVGVDVADVLGEVVPDVAVLPRRPLRVSEGGRVVPVEEREAQSRVGYAGVFEQLVGLLHDAIGLAGTSLRQARLRRVERHVVVAVVDAVADEVVDQPEGHVRREVVGLRLERVPARGHLRAGEQVRRRVTVHRDELEEPVLVTDGVLLVDDEGHIGLRVRRRVVEALDPHHRVHEDERRVLTPERFGRRAVVGVGLAERLGARSVREDQRHGDLDGPLQVVLRPVRALGHHEAVRHQRGRRVHEVRALVEALADGKAQRGDVAHVVLVEIDLHPLARFPVELLVLFVEVALLPVEVHAVLQVHVRDRPGVDDLARHVGAGVGLDVTLVDHLQLVGGDDELHVPEAAAEAGVGAREDAEAGERVRRGHLGDRRLQEPARIGVRPVGREEVLAEVLVLVEHAVTRRAVGDAARGRLATRRECTRRRRASVKKGRLHDFLSLIFPASLSC